MEPLNRRPITRRVATAEVVGLDQGTCTAFRGIRYARASRLARPVAEPLTGTVDATAFGAAAPQPLGAPGLVPGLEPTGEVSEDCLTLNVWTPAGADGLPVFVWIHGGSFLTGTASSPTFDGSRLAEGGLVVVSVQYRLGPFGFLDLSAHGGTELGLIPNAGLHDVLCALGWVRDHIEAFGGDAARVTVCGESAGGGTILHLLGAPARAERFDRAIVQSGSTGRTFDARAAAAVAERFLELADCTDVAAFVRAPASRLVAASIAIQSDPEAFAVAGLMPFHPAIDDVLVLDAPDRALAAGAGSGCDLVLGVTRDEMQLFVMDVELHPDRLVRRVAKYLGVDDESARAVCARYGAVDGGAGSGDDPRSVWGAIYSDREMLLPARAALDAQAATGTRTFGYRFDWDTPPRPDGRLVGSAHGVDIPFIFGNFGHGWLEFLGATRADDAERLSASMRASWTAFAASGDPSTSAVAWPEWDATRRAVVFGESVSVANDPIGARARALRA